MAFKKGNSLGGRTKGSKNKSTSEVRAAFQRLVEQNIQQLEKDLEQLEPVQRVKMIIELSKFVLPTLKASEIEMDFKEQPLFPKIEFFKTPEN